MRREKDMLGSMDLPEDALYGLQTARAVENFPVGGRRTNLRLIYAMVQVKKAAATAYRELELMKEEKANAILSG